MSKLEPIDPGQLQRWFRSDVQSMTAYQPGEQPPWGKTIKLNTNENPYPPTTKIREAIAEALRMVLTDRDARAFARPPAR